MSIFSSVKAMRPKRSLFDLSNHYLGTGVAGRLYPVMCQEVVPGDRWKQSDVMNAVLQPLVSPAMAQIDMTVHYFFVPFRIIYQDWEKFITGGESGSETPVFPYATVYSKDVYVQPQIYGKHSLLSYFGINLEGTSGSSVLYDVPVMPLMAYQLIYSDYYRDQNFETDPLLSIFPSRMLPSGDCQHLFDLSSFRVRSYHHDYFSSCLPTPQRGVDVTSPFTIPEQQVFFKGGDSSVNDYSVTADSSGNATSKTNSGKGKTGTLATPGVTAGGFTIADLRRTARLQEWLERNMRGGSRYVEQLLSHFGVKSPDARLQRPEFLGGCVSPVKIGSVFQTSSTDTTSPQATRAGMGVVQNGAQIFDRSFTEHGYIIGIASFLPSAVYKSGIPRQFLHTDKFEFYWPEFAHLGEQPVYASELQASDNTLGPNSNGKAATFGYLPRYSEYKFIPNSVHGDFLDNLEFWAPYRKFSSSTVPTLNKAFVQYDGMLDQIFAVSPNTEDSFLFDIYHSIRALRPMPKFGTPML